MPKVEGIRMIYNMTYSGLNSSIWEHHFVLPTVGSTLQAVERGGFVVECDIEDIFLNFVLSKKVTSFCGVDVSNLRTEE